MANDQSIFSQRANSMAVNKVVNMMASPYPIGFDQNTPIGMINVGVKGHRKQLLQKNFKNEQMMSPDLHKLNNNNRAHLYSIVDNSIESDGA